MPAFIQVYDDDAHPHLINVDHIVEVVPAEIDGSAVFIVLSRPDGRGDDDEIDAIRAVAPYDEVKDTLQMMGFFVVKIRPLKVGVADGKV